MRVRDKHPGSATLVAAFELRNNLIFLGILKVVLLKTAIYHEAIEENTKKVP